MPSRVRSLPDAASRAELVGVDPPDDVGRPSEGRVTVLADAAALEQARDPLEHLGGVGPGRLRGRRAAERHRGQASAAALSLPRVSAIPAWVVVFIPAKSSAAASASIPDSILAIIAGSTSHDSVTSEPPADGSKR